VHGRGRISLPRCVQAMILGDGCEPERGFWASAELPTGAVYSLGLLLQGRDRARGAGGLDGSGRVPPTRKCYGCELGGWNVLQRGLQNMGRLLCWISCRYATKLGEQVGSMAAYVLQE